ncbi:hypothetical protein FGO68_gene7972 [Halteria grandinella]|uniref:Uncharacterized protein n=1 Tax=Halteria grandinella TaxID=5974 RepID=A0A8J8SYQ6_HALGN|nr:hypothetical protein FGO68_gene7972 [Halteria grandinella]
MSLWSDHFDPNKILQTIRNTAPIENSYGQQLFNPLPQHLLKSPLTKKLGGEETPQFNSSSGQKQANLELLMQQYQHQIRTLQLSLRDAESQMSRSIKDNQLLVHQNRHLQDEVIRLERESELRARVYESDIERLKKENQSLQAAVAVGARRGNGTNRSNNLGQLSVRSQKSWSAIEEQKTPSLKGQKEIKKQQVKGTLDMELFIEAMKQRQQITGQPAERPIVDIDFSNYLI